MPWIAGTIGHDAEKWAPTATGATATGRATEVDSALPIAPVQGLGHPSELDVARPMGLVLGLGQALETEATTPFVAGLFVPIGRALETDLAHAATPVAIDPPDNTVRLIIELDTAGELVPAASITLVPGRAESQNVALPLTLATVTVVALATAAEVASAGALTRVLGPRAQTLGQAGEIDMGRVVAEPPQIRKALEQDSAQSIAVRATKTVPIARVEWLDGAYPITRYRPPIAGDLEVNDYADTGRRVFYS